MMIQDATTNKAALRWRERSFIDVYVVPFMPSRLVVN